MRNSHAEETCATVSDTIRDTRSEEIINTLPDFLNNLAESPDFYNDLPNPDPDSPEAAQLQSHCMERINYMVFKPQYYWPKLRLDTLETHYASRIRLP